MDNDAYGHVNNVTFYSWFDTAVNAWLVDVGLLDVGHGAVIGLVVETGCRYFQPVSFPQTVGAGIRVGDVGRTSVRYEIGIFHDRETTPAAEGHFVHVYVDRQTRRPVAVPAHWRGLLATIAV